MNEGAPVSLSALKMWGGIYVYMAIKRANSCGEPHRLNAGQKRPNTKTRILYDNIQGTSRSCAGNIRRWLVFRKPPAAMEITHTLNWEVTNQVDMRGKAISLHASDVCLLLHLVGTSMK